MEEQTENNQNQTEKPIRIKGDPEGYELVFDDVLDASCCNCERCDFIDSEMCEGKPCFYDERPEGRGIHYVKT